MKRIFTLLTVLLLSFATITEVSASPLAGPYQTHKKKDGTPDKRFKENKKPKPLTKSGKPDMRYKANNPNAGKKKKTK